MNEQQPKKRPHTVRVRGPIYTSQPMDRIVKTYPISEHELTIIGDLSNSATVAFSAASALASLAVGLYLDIVQEADPTTKNVWLINGIIIGLLVIGALSAGAGIWFVCRKTSHLKDIKSGAVEQRVQ